MRYYIQILILIVLSQGLNGQEIQDTLDGKISYVSLRNVYTKFASTKSLSIGDTLYKQESGRLEPVLLILNKSSSSCVCNRLGDKKMEVGEPVYFLGREEKKKETVEKEREAGDMEKKMELGERKEDKEEEVEATKEGYKEQIRGRISVSSYFNFYDSDRNNSQRMRYTFSLKGNHVRDSRLSMESYISFKHKSGEWGEVQENINRALKIYSLGLKYEIDESMEVWMGRKTNRKIANIGAIDGLQVEKRLKGFSMGAIVGSRPDYRDYGLNYHYFNMVYMENTE